jgi:hypothetical protein
MKVGDQIQFPFGGKEKEGIVLKIFPKKVRLRVDFPRHPGKTVVRSLAALEGKNPVPKPKRKEKAAKEKSASGIRKKSEKEKT